MWNDGKEEEKEKEKKKRERERVEEEEERKRRKGVKNVVQEYRIKSRSHTTCWIVSTLYQLYRQSNFLPW